MDKLDARNAVAIVVGLYVITKMLALIGGTAEWQPGLVIRVMAILTILTTVAIITALVTGYGLSGGW